MKNSCLKTRIGLWGVPVAKQYVNLDALIAREDIYAKEQVVQSTQEDSGVKTSELEERSIWFKSLKKPDFQRETASWEPEKIADLIECFVKGHFIPSLIMWRSSDGKLFVIDGAHRLSVLIAWVRDDYGDKDMSIRFFKNEIPAEQKRIAQKTRDLVNLKVGAFAEMPKIIDNPHSLPEKVTYARNSGTLPLTIQWVRGNAETAESSFLKINQSSTPIDPTEFQMIKSRRKPNAIASRALIRAGVGHKYWGLQTTQAQVEVEKIAKEIYEMLFVPPLESPIKTLDLPVAGKGYSAESVKLIFDFVNLVNGTIPSQSKRANAILEELIPDDNDGTETVKYLKKIHEVISIICSDAPSSLGLHPAVYFYSSTGRYQPAAFLATVSLIVELASSEKFLWFTNHRKKFEEFLVDHRYFVNQISAQFGGGLKSYGWVLKFYKAILENLETGKENELVTTLVAMEGWRLKGQDTKPGKFSTDTKSAIYLRDALNSAVKCSICGARMHKNSISFDHINRREDGGSAHSDNGQPTHPYCNTGYKEKLHSQNLKVAS